MNTKDTAFIAQKIRSQYVEKEEGELEALRALDKKVKRPASIFGYIFGSVGALTLGTGMCLAMEIIGDAMIPGIVVGLVGIAMVSITYKLYSKILEKRRKKYAKEILSITDKLVKE